MTEELKLEELRLALKYLAYNLNNKFDPRPLRADYAQKLSRFAFDVLNGKSCQQAEADNDL